MQRKRKEGTKEAQSNVSYPPPAKKVKVTESPKTKAKGKVNVKVKNAYEGGNEDEFEEEEETYHFIGYVPAHGKVWELDGLKSGPLEVGELTTTSMLPSEGGFNANQGWMDVVRPALRMKMEKYGASGKNDGSNIRFNLLAIVDDLL